MQLLVQCIASKRSPQEIPCGCQSFYTPYRTSISLIADSTLTHHRVIELCVGIICSSLPIFVVLFKRVSKNSSYLKVVQYVHALSGTKKAETRRAKQSISYRLKQRIPKPVMTGLRSFLERHDKGESSVIPSENNGYDTLDSVNDDYHAQLKNGRIRR